VPWKKFLGIFLLPCLLIVLGTCTLDVEIPNFRLEIIGDTIYPSAATVTFQYRFIAEEPLHPCRYSLMDDQGTVFDSGQTPLLSSGEWHTYSKDLTGLLDGIYNFRLVVQVEKSPGVYVDLSFLDKEVEFYIDGTAPLEPSADLSSGTYVGDQLVALDHPEWSMPSGSPVKLYYTLDGSTPTVASPEYTGGTITVTAQESPPVELRAVAIDLATNPSPVTMNQYSFMEIISAVNTATSQPEVSINVPGGFFNVIIAGYGFDDTTPADVKFMDVDGTEIWSTVVSDAPTEFILNANIANAVGGGNGVVDPGMGTIQITNSSPNIATDTIQFEITDP
jgi:hypothetical protein